MSPLTKEVMFCDIIDDSLRDTTEEFRLLTCVEIDDDDDDDDDDRDRDDQDDVEQHKVQNDNHDVQKVEPSNGRRRRSGIRLNFSTKQSNDNNNEEKKKDNNENNKQKKKKINTKKLKKKKNKTKKKNHMNANVLSELRELPGNNVCIDCLKKNPDWASIPLGILLCLQCSGEHRSLGTHISYVRSLKIDTWTEEEVSTLRHGGNLQCALFLMKHGGINGQHTVRQRYDSACSRHYKKVLKAEALGQKPPILPPPETFKLSTNNVTGASRSGATIMVEEMGGLSLLLRPAQTAINNILGVGTNVAGRFTFGLPTSPTPTPRRLKKKMEGFGFGSDHHRIKNRNKNTIHTNLRNIDDDDNDDNATTATISSSSHHTHQDSSDSDHGDDDASISSAFVAATGTGAVFAVADSPTASTSPSSSKKPNGWKQQHLPEIRVSTTSLPVS